MGIYAVGIIPAYAGSTQTPAITEYRIPGSSPHTRGARRTYRRQRTIRRDHPRIRGEHPLPRLRIGGIEGIIPAYAGSTPTSLM